MARTLGVVGLAQLFGLVWFSTLVLAQTNIAQTNVAQANAPASAKVLSTNLKGFGIPFRINANDQSYIEVQLYLSEDQGKTWRFHDRQSTDKIEFPFTADADGEYWFALKTLNRNRQLIPEGKTQPELIITVDTVKPELSFQIESDPAGRVAVRWRAFDTHLDANTLQILYQAVGSNPDSWNKVPVNLNGTVRNGLYADQVAWWPETVAEALNVRIAISDAAGNLVQQDRRINVAPSPWRHRAASTARTGDANSSGQILQQPAADYSGQPNGSNGFSDQPPAQPFPAPDQTAQYPSAQQAFAGSLPHGSSANPDLICENGVCRLKPKNDVVNQADVPIPQGAGQNQNLPRVAGLNNGVNRNLQVPLIGGPPEYAAPPVPPGYVPPVKVASRPQSFNSQSPSNGSYNSGNSVPWTSETERWTKRNQSTSSTTLAPDPRMLPNPYVDKPINDQHLPSANPNVMKTVGDQVIGESTTRGPNNQYRGLTPQTNPYVAPTVTTGQPVGNRMDPNSATNPVAELAQADQQNWQSGYNPPPQSAHFSTASSPQEITKAPGNTWPTESETANREAYVDETDPSLMMIGSKRFRLNYGIDAIDPSGVAKVDLWMTRDGGKNWTAWGSDPDNTSPISVEVQEEGRYGFRIVVHSKDGLTGRGPSSGDSADIWVHVDTQSPLAQIVSVPYGRAEEAGRLVINYRVADPFLTLRPINIAYSQNPDGPWTLIGEGLRNEGRYLWKPTSNVPDRIFLRLDARDRAGNLGVHQLCQAIDVSGLVPRGTIHGVIPVGVQK